MSGQFCIQLGSRTPVAIASVQPVKPLPLGKSVPTFGKTIQVCTIGKREPVIVARMEPKK